MKRINKHKKHSGFIPLLISFLLITGFANAQRTALFNYQQNPVLTKQQQHYADAWTKLDWVSSHNIVKIDPALFDDNYLNINLPGNQSVVVVKNQLIPHPSGSFSWKGVINEPPGNGDFVVNKGMITGRISSLTFTYLLYPLTGGYHVLLACDGSRMPQDESEEGYNDMMKNGLESYLNRDKDQKHVDPEVQGQTEMAGACRVRILVAYTDDADVNLADPVSFCQSCIDVTNTCYSNSSVYFDCEMAVAIREVYTESLNSTTDKNRLQNTSDGFLDDVHDYRSIFDADMCIMITENLQAGICGEAYVVANSTYTQPFCVVTRGCAVGNLSFPHELGHLYGCRHDPYVDGGNTPYAYGHGYVRLASQWRTVMAYNDYCTDNGSSCTRLQYFSNPAVTYGGNAMGVAGTNDNESALEASVPNISSLETTVTNKIFAVNQSFSSGEYADVIGGTSVTNNSGITFDHLSGSVGTWRAGTYIDLKEGFWARSGSDFTAFLDNCTALKPAAEEMAPSPMHEFLTASKESVQTYPNPFTNQFDLLLSTAEAGKVTVQLFNLMGEKVKDLFDQTLDLSGSYKFTFEAAELKPGIYFIVVNTPTGMKTAKLTKVQ